MWFSLPIFGPIILLFLAKPCISVNGCTVILRNPKSSLKKAVCNTPDSVLTSIPLDLPETLAELFISFQNVKIIYNKEFIHLHNLESLSITSSNVHTIQEGAFITLSKLKILILTNNSLIVSSENQKSLSKYIFLPLLDLRTLDLSQNFIGDIPDFFFSHVNQTLEVLQLSHSKSEIILSKNSLMYLGILKCLKLDYSRITRFKSNLEESLDMMMNLNEIILLGNLWHCDCELKWFIIWMLRKFKSSKIFKSSHNNLICQTPPLMKGRDLLKENLYLINEKVLQCIPEPLTSNSTISTYVGQNISLSCVFKNLNKNQEIFWKNQNELFDSQGLDNKMTIVETKGTYHKSVLTIRNISKSDEGIWSCFINHNNRPIEVGFLVNIEMEYISDNSFSTTTHSNMNTKTIVVYALVSSFLTVVFIIILALVIFCLKYYKGNFFSSKTHPNFNFFTRKKSKGHFYKFYNKSNSLKPITSISLLQDSIKLDEKIYDNVPIPSGFYINFTKKKNEQNFSTLNCMDCQNYAIVGDSVKTNSDNFNMYSKTTSPRFWYLDDTVDGTDYIQSTLALRKDTDDSDTSDRDAAFITRTPSKTPCPVHSSKVSVNTFKHSLSDSNPRKLNRIEELESCPIHGSKSIQIPYSVHFSIPDNQLNKSSTNTILSSKSPKKIKNSFSTLSEKSRPHNYFPVYLSSLDVQLKDESKLREYSCLSNSAV